MPKTVKRTPKSNPKQDNAVDWQMWINSLGELNRVLEKRLESMLRRESEMSQAIEAIERAILVASEARDAGQKAPEYLK